MKLLVIALGMLGTTRAHADPVATWIIDAGLRGAGSFPIGEQPSERVGIAPSVSLRTLHAMGRFHIGPVLALAAPAYFGRLEIGASAELAHELSARVTIATGLDAGVGMLVHDAPPELPAESDALLYYGLFGRGRVQLRFLSETPNGKQVGFNVGAGLALTSARYFSTASGEGMRLEPSLELGISIGL